MKKEIKKIVSTLGAVMLAGGMINMVASAAPADMKEWTFENMSVGASGEKDGLYTKSLVQVDPMKPDGQNYALELTSKIDIYKGVYDTAAPKNNKTTVWEFDVYVGDGAVGTDVTMTGQKLFTFYEDKLCQNGDKNWVGGTLNLNKWNNVKIVSSYVSMKNDDGEYVCDTSKSKHTIYVNGKKGFDRFFTDANLAQTVKVIKAGTGMFIDNVKLYTVPDTTEYSLTDYNGAAFMGGKEIMFDVSEILGADVDCLPLDGVEFYDNGEFVSGSVAPNKFYYAPKSAGKHVISAKGYISDVYGDEPIEIGSTEVFVEPNFTENVVIEEDFEDYTDGVTSWKVNDKNYLFIRNTTADSAPKGIEVDSVHGKSLDIGTASGRTFLSELNLNSGTLKISGEYYFTSDTSWDNLFLTLNNGVSDLYSLALRGTSVEDLVNSSGFSGETIAKIQKGKWYKFDYVTTFTKDKGFYTLYVNGKRVSQSVYNYVNRIDSSADRYTYLERINKVVFLSCFNSVPLYVDNVSVSLINYHEDTGFFCNDIEVDSINEMEGTYLTAKTAYPNGEEAKQYMAIYDKKTNKLIDIVIGEYDGRTETFEVGYDLEELVTGNTDFEVKVFVWSGMRPIYEVDSIE